jgi:hypothetical protein
MENVGRGMRVTQPFDFAQGHELVEWLMGVFRQPQQNLLARRRNPIQKP